MFQLEELDGLRDIVINRIQPKTMFFAPLDCSFERFSDRKGHCKLSNAGETAMDAIAAYMSKECLCPKEDYKGALMESILQNALFDYIANADKPDRTT